jgi:ribonuclease P protein component
MLAKIYHLTEQSDFDLVRKNGKVIHSTNFNFGFLRREAGTAPRFGFVVPNKVIPKAHDRNRVKRVLAEATRFQLATLSPLVDCVFLPKQSILHAYTADVMKEVAEVFKKAKILAS